VTRRDRAAIERFARAARDFCSYVESAPAMSPATYRRLARSLAHLCALALDLPDVELSRRLPRGLEKKRMLAFGDRDHYREVFDAYSADNALVGSLSDDMGDIYNELADGLAVFDGARAARKTDATWAWRFGFHIHWGEHATSALRALYWLIRRAEEG
jgi:hypothetical protein